MGRSVFTLLTCPFSRNDIRIWSTNVGKNLLHFGQCEWQSVKMRGRKEVGTGNTI